MKKTVSLLLIFILAFSICGCSNRNQYSESAIEAAKSAIFYSEQYINGAISAEDADEHIDSVYEDFQVYLTTHKDSETYDKDFLISSKILSLSIAFTYESFGDSEITNIKNETEELKKEIGY